MRTIIDLGCGTGNELEHYSLKKYRLVGVDLNEENINICREKMPGGVWIVGDASEVDLNEFSDVKKIICSEVLEHVENWRGFLRNLSRVPAGARLDLTVPREKSEQKLLAKRKNYWEEIGHRRSFSGEEIQEELKKNGWKNIRQKRVNAALYFELRLLFNRDAPCVRHTYYQNILPLPLKIFFQLFRADLFRTKLKYFPLWIITLPVAVILDKIWGATIRITAIKGNC